VDAVSDGSTTVIGAIMEHIEEAGIHSGDSACVIPPHTLSDEIITTIKKYTCALAKELKVKGLFNLQCAVKADTVYMLEVNPRASRTVPFVSKATGIPLAKIAASVMAGKKLADFKIDTNHTAPHVAVKEAVLPFSRFSGVDIILGPEMKSTGEVMGIDYSFGRAFFKAEAGANETLPLKGKVFLSVKNDDKRNIVFIAKKLYDMNFSLIATNGTWKVLTSNNIKAERIDKITAGSNRLLNLIKKGKIKLIINTPSGKVGQFDMKTIRNVAVRYGVPCITTISGAQAAVNGIEEMLGGEFNVQPLQKYLKKLKG
jgi:carbamoyl-phosphate synthase large subunit